MDDAKQPAVLAIGGLDSSGGAGLTADLLAVTTLGVRSVLACTAVTAQTAAGVVACHPVPPDVVAAQIEAAFESCAVRAVKTGMLVNADVVRAVAAGLARKRGDGAEFALVVDPVLAASAGGELLSEEGLSALISGLLPMAQVVTPNLDEAARLTGTPVSSPATMKLAAQKVHALGASHVVVTGGHLADQPTDVLFDGAEFHELPGRRLPGDVHGAGCTYSASFAAYLAKGMPVHKAAAGAKQMACMRIEGSL